MTNGTSGTQQVFIVWRREWEDRSQWSPVSVHETREGADNAALMLAAEAAAHPHYLFRVTVTVAFINQPRV